MSCFADIVALGGVFTSAKDVSESMGGIHAASRFGVGDEAGGRGDCGGGEGVLCLCIGDGCTPRTAVLASFVKKGWRTVSIDPNLREEWEGAHGDRVRGMIGYRGTLEEFLAEPCVEDHIPRPNDNDNNDGDVSSNGRERPKTDNAPKPKSKLDSIHHLVLLCVHSHNNFRDTARIDAIRTRYGSPQTTLVSIPCCPGFRHVADIGRPPDVKYEDDCIFSACRVVSVWNFDEGDADGAGAGGKGGKDNDGRVVGKTTSLSQSTLCSSVGQMVID